MTRPCRDLAPLLSERAAGPLPAADEARVAEHLASCAACRAEAARLAEVLSLARVPAASAAEERLARDLPARIAVAARRGPDRSRALGLGLGLGFAAAAALVAVALPGRMGRHPAPEAAMALAEPRSAALADPSAIALAEADALAEGEADVEALWDLSADIDTADVVDDDF